MFVVASVMLVLATGVAWFFGLRGSSRPIEGRIQLRTSQCDLQGDSVEFEVGGFNRTTRPLDGMTARVFAGAAGDLTETSVALERLLPGDGFRFTTTLPAPERLEVCFVRFFVGAREVQASFRP